MTNKIHFRKAVRTIILTPDKQILLMKINAPNSNMSFWITPGGGLEKGENIETGIKRELIEELGLTDFTLGAIVWLRQHTFNWGEKRICQKEQYHIVHIQETFEPVITDPTEAAFLHEFKWWPLSALTNSREQFVPESLAKIVTEYLISGPPPKVPEMEILVD